MTMTAEKVGRRAWRKPERLWIGALLLLPTGLCHPTAAVTRTDLHGKGHGLGQAAARAAAGKRRRCPLRHRTRGLGCARPAWAHGDQRAPEPSQNKKQSF